MEKNFICINCPVGCNITVTLDNGKIADIKGNSCAKGIAYVTKEIESPARLVTSTVKVTGGTGKVASVRTRNEIPKDKIFECMEIINSTQVKAPIKVGDVIIKDVFGTDIIATSNT